MRRAVFVAARRARFSGWEEGTTRSLTETLSSLLATPPSVLRPPGYVLQTRCSTLGALCSCLYTRFERPNPLGFRFVVDLPPESDESNPHRRTRTLYRAVPRTNSSQDNSDPSSTENRSEIAPQRAVAVTARVSGSRG